MKKGKQVLAILLSAAMIIQAAPLQVMAEEDAVHATIQTDEEIADPIDFTEPSTDDVRVVCEIDSQRDIAEKHFRLSNGSYVAVGYPYPVFRCYRGQSPSRLSGLQRDG